MGHGSAEVTDRAGSIPQYAEAYEGFTAATLSAPYGDDDAWRSWRLAPAPPSLLSSLKLFVWEGDLSGGRATSYRTFGHLGGF